MQKVSATALVHLASLFKTLLASLAEESLCTSSKDCLRLSCFSLPNTTLALTALGFLAEDWLGTSCFRTHVAYWHLLLGTTLASFGKKCLASLPRTALASLAKFFPG